jgi:hypothetical protein
MATIATAQTYPSFAFAALPWLKFDHDQYFFSEFRAKANAFAKAAYLDLICIAMKQRPAFSVPNDDGALIKWLGISLQKWLKIKDLVLAQFVFNSEENRYYSQMLMDAYQPNTAITQQTELVQPLAKTSTHRVRKHRALRQQNSLTTETAHETLIETLIETPETLHETECNAACNAKTVSVGGTKGGELELKEELKEEVIVVDANETQKHTSTPFVMNFDFQPQPSAIAALISRLNVEPHKNTPENLNNFIAYYQVKHFKNTQAQWEFQYVKWLQREKGNTTTQIVKPTAPLVIVGKPLWELLAERKAACESAPPKSVKSLLASQTALAEIREKLGVKVA